ncbi:hypothetical protein HFO86_34695 [Rhizobium leguminosarum]|uniref:hypothetical protein n=1 Tax=Rhizobium leguminosarum TaxID=384 RepID=UPI001C958D36|nr:hypothetical protein [Rhizobium leguminosarum]MBY5475294.1 hypothetical protein [Rhizobium leguminosarum]
MKFIVYFISILFSIVNYSPALPETRATKQQLVSAEEDNDYLIVFNFCRASTTDTRPGRLIWFLDKVNECYKDFGCSMVQTKSGMQGALHCEALTLRRRQSLVDMTDAFNERNAKKCSIPNSGPCQHEWHESDPLGRRAEGADRGPKPPPDPFGNDRAPVPKIQKKPTPNNNRPAPPAVRPSQRDLSTSCAAAKIYHIISGREYQVSVVNQCGECANIFVNWTLNGNYGTLAGEWKNVPPGATNYYSIPFTGFGEVKPVVTRVTSCGG